VSSRGYYAYREAGCMPACVATMLGEHHLAWSLPTATGVAWLERFNEHLAHQAGAFLALIPCCEVPWCGDDEWIAGIEASDGTPHAIVAIRDRVMWDPADELQPGDPLPEVEEGFLMLPDRRELFVTARMGQLERLRANGRVTIGSDA
jgi:hypothetical protein